MPIRIATWNLELAQPGSPAGLVQAEAMSGVRADVWIITECPVDLPLSDCRATQSPPIPGETRSVFTMIKAAKLQTLAAPEIPTGAAALVGLADDHPDEGRWMVVGICMPWRRDRPPLPPSAAPGAATGPEQWNVVLDRLRAAMSRLRSEHPNVPMLLAGDLNESLAGSAVMSTPARNRLQRLLDDFGLESYGAALPSASPGYSSIDHLCGPHRHFQAGHWTAPAVPGRRKLCSDHNGYFVDLDDHTNC